MAHWGCGDTWHGKKLALRRAAEGTGEKVGSERHAGPDKAGSGESRNPCRKSNRAFSSRGCEQIAELIAWRGRDPDQIDAARRKACKLLQSETHMEGRSRNQGSYPSRGKASRPRKSAAAFSTAWDAVKTVSAELCMSEMAVETRCRTETTDFVPDAAAATLLEI